MENHVQFVKNLRKHLYRVFEFNNTGNYPEYVLGYLSMVTVAQRLSGFILVKLALLLHTS